MADPAPSQTPPARGTTGGNDHRRPGRRLHSFEALRVREFRLLWLAHTGNSMAQWMDQITRGWLMYELTNSALELGLVNAVRAVPLLFFSVIAGAFADRYSRKMQLIIGQALNVLLNGILAVLIISGNVQPWHVYLEGFLVGIVSSFQQPARQAMVPDLVGRANLTNAIGLNSVAFNVSRTLGPALSGVLIATTTTGGAYSAQAIIYALSTVWTVLLHVPPETDHPSAHRPPSDASMWQTTVEGVRYIWHAPVIRSLMIVGLTASLLGQPFTSLLPIFARDVLEIGATGQGLLLTAAGVGALTSALLVTTAGHLGRTGLIILTGATLYGIAIIGFALSQWVSVSLLFMALTGLSNVSFGALANTVVQATTPSEVRGRVLGVYMLDRGLTPLGSLMAGALAANIGAPMTGVFMGMACTTVVLAIAFASPQVRAVNAGR